MITHRPDLELVVTAAEAIAPGVRQVTLAARGDVRLPSFRPGSHLGLAWRPGRVNFYSLTGDGDCPGAYTVSVQYIGRQVAEDLVLLDAREGHLYADAGLVSFASGWSFPFARSSPG